jgi:hypothetical protein
MVKIPEPPERLHLPPKDQTHCSNGHELVDIDGQPTEHSGWRQNGEHLCASCHTKDWAVLKAVEQDNGNTTGECPNGHEHMPDNVSYIFKAGKRHRALIKCKICGATDPIGVQKAEKAPNQPVYFDQAHHTAYDPAKHGSYEKYNPAVFAHFKRLSEEDYRPRARAKQTDFQPMYDENGTPNFNIHTMIERGFRGGALKDGDEISWDHFIPIAAGGSQSFHNLMATSLKFNKDRKDAVPSLYEARKFGFGAKDFDGNPNPHNMEALIKAINPRNISYLNDKDEVDLAPGHIRHPETGKITGSIGHSKNKGMRAMMGKYYLTQEGHPTRAYDPATGGPGHMRLPGMITEYRPRADVTGYQAGGPSLGGGVLQTAGAADFDLRSQAKRAKRGGAGTPQHPDEIKAGVKTLPGELYNKQRHEAITEHLKALEAATGPIRMPVTPNNPEGKFDTGPQGHAYFHVTPQGSVTRNPHVSAHIQRFLEVEGAKSVGLAEEHAQLLGHPMDFRPPTDHAAYIKRLEDVTGPIKFGNQPHTLSVAPRTPRNEAGEPLVSHLKDPGEIINPAIQQHVREYTRQQGGLKQARHTKLMLSMRKVQRDVSQPVQSCYLSASIQRQGRRNTTIRVGCQSYR